jgi:hypothetical protein
MAREHDSLCFSTARLDCPPFAQSGRVSFTMPKGKDFRSVKLASGARDGTLRMFFWTVRRTRAATPAKHSDCLLPSRSGLRALRPLSVHGRMLDSAATAL